MTINAGASDQAEAAGGALMPAKARRAFAVYGAVAVLAVMLFVLLHHFGNRTGATAAMPRLTEESKRYEPPSDTLDRQHDRQAYCDFSLAVLAADQGPRDDVSGSDFWSPPRSWSARRPRWLRGDVLGSAFWPPAAQPTADSCATLTHALGGTDVPDVEPAAWNSRLHALSWGGGKALYAIALPHLSVFELHWQLDGALYAAWGAFAIGLLLLGYRALLVGCPVVVFGMAFSGIGAYPNLASGPSQLWAIVGAASVGLLLGHGARPSVARVWCFFVGMVSCYLWWFDSVPLMAAALIGVVAWLAYERFDSRRRARLAAACVGLFGTGFAAAFCLGLLTKAWFFAGALATALAGAEPTAAAETSAAGLERYLGVFVEMTSIGVSTTALLLGSAALAIGVPTLVAIAQAWRRAPTALADVGWFALMLVIAGVALLAPSHPPLHGARMLFLPLALCWCALLATLTRLPRPLVHAAGFVAVAGVLLFAFRFAQDRMSERALRALNTEDLVASGRYDIYVKDRRLYLVAANCEGDGVERKIALRVNRAPPFSYVLEELDYYYFNQRLPTLGPGCAAAIDLPRYELGRIALTWACCEPEPAYVEFDFRSRGQRVWERAELLAAVELARPLNTGAQTPFRMLVHAGDLRSSTGKLADRTLIYARENCGVADLRPRFFLHAIRPAADAEGEPLTQGQSEFVNTDFWFLNRGFLRAGACYAAVPLPTNTAVIRTGQFARSGELWSYEANIAS